MVTCRVLIKEFDNLIDLIELIFVWAKNERGTVFWGLENSF